VKAEQIGELILIALFKFRLELQWRNGGSGRRKEYVEALRDQLSIKTWSAVVGRDELMCCSVAFDLGH